MKDECKIECCDYLIIGDGLCESFLNALLNIQGFKSIQLKDPSSHQPFADTSQYMTVDISQDGNNDETNTLINQQTVEDSQTNNKSLKLFVEEYSCFFAIQSTIPKLIINKYIHNYVTISYITYQHYLEQNNQICKIPFTKKELYYDQSFSLHDKKQIYRLTKCCTQYCETDKVQIDSLMDNIVQQQNVQDIFRFLNISIQLQQCIQSQLQVTSQCNIETLMNKLKVVLISYKNGNTAAPSPYCIMQYGCSDFLQTIERLSFIFNGIVIPSSMFTIIDSNNVENEHIKHICVNKQIIKLNYLNINEQSGQKHYLHVFLYKLTSQLTQKLQLTDTDYSILNNNDKEILFIKGTNNEVPRGFLLAKYCAFENEQTLQLDEILKQKHIWSTNIEMTQFQNANINNESIKTYKAHKWNNIADLLFESIKIYHQILNLHLDIQKSDTQSEQIENILFSLLNKLKENS